MSLQPFEFAVLTKLLEGSHPVLDALRAQLPRLCVSRREVTGVGFYTYFALEDEDISAPLVAGDVRFGDVDADIKGLKNGAGFVLYVRNGRVHMLEGYSYEEPWPPRIDEFTLAFADPSRRSVFKTLSGAMVGSGSAPDS